MNYKLTNCLLENEINDVKLLLQQHNLKYENNVTYTIGLYDEKKIVATGSLHNNVIKMIAVDRNYQGENLATIIMTNLIQQLSLQKMDKYFLYTTPDNKEFFMRFSLSLVYETKDIVMLENNVFTIEEQLLTIKKTIPVLVGTTAALVMKCNPVTLSHLLLIETCAIKHDKAIIFLVEDDTAIPYKVRKDLLEKTTKNIKNVYIVPATKYIISPYSFPTYFLKDSATAFRIYNDLDVSIFAHYFMKIFEIDFRYVAATQKTLSSDTYIQSMTHILKEQLIMIPPLYKDGIITTTSLIRKHAKKRNYSLIKHLLPEASYNFLTSDKGKDVL